MNTKAKVWPVPDVAQLLQSLHPMREPPPPSPVEPFLLTLVLGFCVAIVGLVVWRQVRRRRAGLRRSAEAALAATRGLAPPERFAAQARLLRRLVRAQSGETAARAHGEGWLAALDGTFATTFFTSGAGRAYADTLYRRDGAGRDPRQVDALDRSLADFIARLGARGTVSAK